VRSRAVELLAAIRAVLEGGIARRGTTLRDYVDADGRGGDNAPALRVYGRAGEACRRCGARIKRSIDGGRATFFCPGCQRR
jgi:formamidopyrimidine-DNA glycosylase